MNPTVKTDLNSDVWFKRYDFLKIEVAKINVRESVSRTSPYAFNANKKHSLTDKKDTHVSNQPGRPFLRKSGRALLRFQVNNFGDLPDKK